MQEERKYKNTIHLTLDKKRFMALKIINSQTGLAMTDICRRSLDRYLPYYLGKKPHLKMMVDNITNSMPEVD